MDFKNAFSAVVTASNTKDILKEALVTKLQLNGILNGVIENIEDIGNNNQLIGTYFQPICVGSSGEEEYSEEERKENKDLYQSISSDERRMRNRLAARKCREKRKTRIQNLEKICSNLEIHLLSLNKEVDNLKYQCNSLIQILTNHVCVNQIGTNQVPLI